VLESGSVSFFLIERVGKYGVRVRDKNNPHRVHFTGLQYFRSAATGRSRRASSPTAAPAHSHSRTFSDGKKNMDCPGALVFTRDGHEYRLDAVLEEPDAEELFVMFADGTSGRETYGAGRFLYLPLPVNGKVPLDFTRAYSPPCAFNEFATCHCRRRRTASRCEWKRARKNYVGVHAP